MAAGAAAFSWGVFTDGNADVIPDVNAVFQWYGMCPDGNSMRLNVLYRNYNPDATITGGPFFSETKFTVEAAIRRCFNVASQISVQKIAQQYNEKLRETFLAKLKESEESRTTDFIALFGSMTEVGLDETEGGFAFMEPFSNGQINPPLQVQGCVFPRQGMRGEKRIRLMTETENSMLVPMHLVVNTGNASSLAAAGGQVPLENPRGDVRLLAGSISIGNPQLYVLLLQFVNQLIPEIRFMSLDNANINDLFVGPGNAAYKKPFAAPQPNDISPATAAGGPEPHQFNGGANNADTKTNEHGMVATFPTIFKYSDVLDIRGKILAAMGDFKGNPMAFLPFYGDRIVRLINDTIKKSIHEKTLDAAINPLKNLFQYDRRVVAEIVIGNRDHGGASNPQHHSFHIVHREQAGVNTGGTPAGAYTAEEGQIHKQNYTRMQAEINKLTKNPVLWINGPKLNRHQGVEVYDPEKRTQPAWIGHEPAPIEMRPDIIAGFDPDTLKAYCHDAGPEVSAAYHLSRQPHHNSGQLATHYFTTDGVSNSGLRDPTTGVPEPRKGRSQMFLDSQYDGVGFGGQVDPFRKTGPTGEPIRHGRDQFYKNYSDPTRNIMNSINTVYNIVCTPGVAVRLEEWNKAQGIEDTMDTPVEKADDGPSTVQISEPPFHSLVTVPGNETRFRLGLMDPPRVADVDVAKEELDFDAGFKQFEYDMHVGDVDAYTNEILTVIRIALESILISTSEVGVGVDDEAFVVDTLYPDSDVADLYDRVVPVFNLPSATTTPDEIQTAGTEITGGWSAEVKKKMMIQQSRRYGNKPIPHVFKSRPDKYVMSACSQFVYHHVVSHATAPFSTKSRHPSHREVAALLSSLNPFPVRDERTRKFIQNVLNLCKDRLKAAFADDNSFHLVQQMEHTRPSEIRQPYTPVIVNFERTTSSGGGGGRRLKWTAGSESTWVLEGIVLALNLINTIGNNRLDEGAAAAVDVPVADVDVELEPPMVFDVKDDSTSSKYDALQRIKLDPKKSRVKTHRFTGMNRDVVYTAQDYAQWLRITGDRHLNQAGRFFLGSFEAGSDPVGIFSAKSAREIPFTKIRYQDIAETQVKVNLSEGEGSITVSRNDIQLAIDSAVSAYVSKDPKEEAVAYKAANVGAPKMPYEEWLDAMVYRLIDPANPRMPKTHIKLWTPADGGGCRKLVTMLAAMAVASVRFAWLYFIYTKGGDPTVTAAIRNPTPYDFTNAKDVLSRATKLVQQNANRFNPGAGTHEWKLDAADRIKGDDVTPATVAAGGPDYFKEISQFVLDTKVELVGNEGLLNDEQVNDIIPKVIRFIAKRFDIKPFSEKEFHPEAGQKRFKIPQAGNGDVPLDYPFSAMFGLGKNDAGDPNGVYVAPHADYDGRDLPTYDDAFGQQINRMMDGNRQLIYKFNRNTNAVVKAKDANDAAGAVSYQQSQNVAIPLWEAAGALNQVTNNAIGYVVFDRLTVTVGKKGDPGDQQNHARMIMDYYESEISKIVVFDSTKMIRLGQTPTGDNFFCLRTNAFCGIRWGDALPNVAKMFGIRKNVPAWTAQPYDTEVMAKTTNLRIDSVGDKLPFNFNAVQQPPPVTPNVAATPHMNVDGNPNMDATTGYPASQLTDAYVANLLMESFNGLHFSNSRSLHRTVMAVATGTNHKKIRKFLDQTVKSHRRDIPWAVSQHNRIDGNAVLLSMLYSSYEGSTTRSSDVPMADRVLVRCKGPGSADESTPCYVDGHFYRTELFFRIEIKAMEVFTDVVTQTRGTPPGSVVNPIARHFDRIHSIYDLLQIRKEAASAVAKLMINLYEFEKIGHRSGRPRDKASVRIQSGTIDIDARHVLYHI